MCKKIFLSFIAAILCSAAYTVAPAQNQTASPGTGNVSSGDSSLMGIRDYRLGVGDLLDLRVLNETQFDGVLEVNNRGQIVVPFLDEVRFRAQCRTVDEVRKEIIAELTKLLRKPLVSLLVREKRSRTPATLYGAVQVPQQYQMYRSARLQELISRSGGVTEASSGTIEITHTEPLMCPEADDPQASLAVITAQTTDESLATDESLTTDGSLRLPFDVYKISDLLAGKPEANPYIRPGDIIRVEQASPIYVTGLVMQPQGVYLRPQSTLRTVIAQVGGLRREAKNAIKIYRRKSDSPTAFEEIAVNYGDILKQKTPDILLQPYDVIEVGEASVLKGKRLVDTLLGFAVGGAGQALSGGIQRTVLY